MMLLMQVLQCVPWIMFLIGLFILFKGGFQFGTRAITFAKSRVMALTLMGPLVLTFCASFLIALNNPDLLLSMINEEGTLNTNTESFLNLANLIGTVQIVLMVSALVLVGFTLYNAPKGINIPPVQSQFRQGGVSPVSPKAPDIMTVAEAAAYMRLSESEVLSLIEEGRLGAAKIGNSFRIARIAIDDFMGRT